MYDLIHSHLKYIFTLICVLRSKAEEESSLILHFLQINKLRSLKTVDKSLLLNYSIPPCFFFFFFLQLKGSVSAEGAFQGFSSSLSVNMERFREEMSEDTKFGESKITLTSGGMDMPEPIGLRLIPIYEAMSKSFYVASASARNALPCQHTDSFLNSRRKNLETILRDYPRVKRVKKPVGRVVTSILAF